MNPYSEFDTLLAVFHHISDGATTDCGCHELEDRAAQEMLWELAAEEQQAGSSS